MPTDLKPLMDAIGYQFHNIQLLEKALTHSSYSNEGHTHCECYERLEFLGDSVLGFITAQYLFEKDRGPEGELTKLRAAVVCEKALCSYSRQLGIGDYMRLGHGEAPSAPPFWRICMRRCWLPFIWTGAWSRQSGSCCGSSSPRRRTSVAAISRIIRPPYRRSSNRTPASSWNMSW